MEMKSPIPITELSYRRQRRRSYSFSFFSSTGSGTNFSFESSSFSSSPGDDQEEEEEEEEEEKEEDHYSPSSSPVASGVPFSWEQQPGIPKRPNASSFPNSPNSSSSSTHTKLPDPPATTFPAKKLETMEATTMNNSAARRKNIMNSRDGYVGDPFTLALINCCANKDRQLQQYEVKGRSNWKTVTSSKKIIGSSSSAARSFSDRFGFIDLYASCKRTSDVLETNVLIPRSTRLVGHRKN